MEKTDSNRTLMEKLNAGYFIAGFKLCLQKILSELKKSIDKQR